MSGAPSQGLGKYDGSKSFTTLPSRPTSSPMNLPTALGTLDMGGGSGVWGAPLPAVATAGTASLSYVPRQPMSGYADGVGVGQQYGTSYSVRDDASSAGVALNYGYYIPALSNTLYGHSDSVVYTENDWDGSNAALTSDQQYGFGSHFPVSGAASGSLYPNGESQQYMDQYALQQQFQQAQQPQQPQTLQQAQQFQEFVANENGIRSEDSAVDESGGAPAGSASFLPSAAAPSLYFSNGPTAVGVNYLSYQDGGAQFLSGIPAVGVPQLQSLHARPLQTVQTNYFAAFPGGAGLVFPAASSARYLSGPLVTSLPLGQSLMPMESVGLSLNASGAAAVNSSVDTNATGAEAASDANSFGNQRYVELFPSAMTDLAMTLSAADLTSVSQYHSASVPAPSIGAGIVTPTDSNFLVGSGPDALVATAARVQTAPPTFPPPLDPAVVTVVAHEPSVDHNFSQLTLGSAESSSSARDGDDISVATRPLDDIGVLATSSVSSVSSISHPTTFVSASGSEPASVAPPPRKPFSYADALANNPSRKAVPAVTSTGGAGATVKVPTSNGYASANGREPSAVSVGGSLHESKVAPPRHVARPVDDKKHPLQQQLPPSHSMQKGAKQTGQPQPKMRTASSRNSSALEVATVVNPAQFVTTRKALAFVIKSYSADDIHKSIKYGVWASTEHGNKRLDAAFRESVASNEPVFLCFSVNGSGCFCGVAQMMSAVDYSNAFGAWAQNGKWPGQFKVKWIFIKNVPNREFRHVILPYNQNKPVTNSRDTQEVRFEHAAEVLSIIHKYRHKTSILDDFDYFDQEEAKKKADESAKSNPSPDSASPVTAPSGKKSAHDSSTTA